jgi:hypothetical protein
VHGLRVALASCGRLLFACHFCRPPDTLQRSRRWPAGRPRVAPFLLPTPGNKYRPARSGRNPFKFMLVSSSGRGRVRAHKRAASCGSVASASRPDALPRLAEKRVCVCSRDAGRHVNFCLSLLRPGICIRIRRFSRTGKSMKFYVCVRDSSREFGRPGREPPPIGVS